jgi:hypothetical protein
MSGDAYHMTAPLNTATAAPLHGRGDADARVSIRRGAVPQRARHLDAAGRQERDHAIKLAFGDHAKNSW